VKDTQKELQAIILDINTNAALIEEKRKETVNIDEAVDNIKNGLIGIGITDFTIEKYSEEDALYRLKREDSSENVFKTLSEGEKMVISFLYFIELCKGESAAEKTSNNKIVVIDDPISSLSHIYIFNIGRLIHNEFLRTDTYDQMFILTHSLYFFYELTNTDHKKRKETQELFRICKNTGGSYFEKMKYEDIQNDYQAYWYIVKDEKQPPALIANCMRNIMEYFFNFVEKQDFAQVFQRPELEETRFMAFNRYMNRESHSKGQNIFDIKEFDYNSFRDAFKKVFDVEGYIDHYNKMISL
jgi:wobble nucleotide-excising tRNase